MRKPVDTKASHSHSTQQYIHTTHVYSNVVNVVCKVYVPDDIPVLRSVVFKNVPCNLVAIGGVNSSWKIEYYLRLHYSRYRRAVPPHMPKSLYHTGYMLHSNAVSRSMTQLQASSGDTAKTRVENVSPRNRNIIALSPPPTFPLTFLARVRADFQNH